MKNHPYGLDFLRTLVPGSRYVNGELINYVAEPFIHFVTFGVVGIYYNRGSNPAVGSILYTIFYFIHVGLLLLCGSFDWNKIAIIVIVALYIACHILLKRVRNSI